MATLPTIAGYHAPRIFINEALTPAAGDTAHAATYTLPAAPSNGTAPQPGDIMVCSFVSPQAGPITKLVAVNEPGMVTAVASNSMDPTAGSASFGLFLFTYTGSNTIHVTVNNDTGRTAAMYLRVFWVRGVSALSDVVVGAAQNRRSHNPIVTTAVFPQPINVPSRQKVLGVDIAAERTVAGETASQITDVDAATLAEVYPNSTMLWLADNDQTVAVFHGDISHLRGASTTEHRVNYPNPQNNNAIALQLAFPAADGVSGRPIKISDGTGLVDAWYKVSDGGGNLSVPGGHKTVNPGYSSIAAMLATKPFFVAHHAAANSYPEMSLYSYGQSVLRGYKSVELSLARTSDGVWFGLHDQNLNRTSGVTGLANASSMTWAQVQGYQILGSLPVDNPSQPNRPYMRFEELMALYYPSHVIFVDARFATAHLAELISKLNALPGTPKDHIVAQAHGTNTGFGDTMRAAGYTTYGYYTEADYSGGSMASSHSRWDIIGMNYAASPAAWTTATSYGKPVIAHVCSSASQIATAQERGATGIMSNSMAIDPTAAYEPINNYRYSFDAGTVGASISTSVAGPGDHAWGGVSVGTGAVFQYDTTHVAHGTKSAKLVPGDPTAMPQGRWSFDTPSTKGAFRYYVRWETNPTVETYPVWLGSSASARVLSLSILPTGVMRLMGPSSVLFHATPASTLPTGSWARIEMAYEIDAGNPANSRCRLVLYSGDSTTPLHDSGWVSANMGSAGVTYVRVGKYTQDANTATHWLDSVAYRTGSSTLIGPDFTPVSGGNQPPVANAGPDQTVVAGSTVVLSGSGSDPDGGTIASYAWTQTSGTPVTLSSSTVANPTFTAPSAAGSLVFSLVVTDNNSSASAADTVTIKVNTAAQGTPIDDAGALPLGTAVYAIPNNAVFVSTSGSDTAAGTEASPFATLAKAISSAPAGGTIVMRAGSYNEGGDTQTQQYPLGIVVNKNITIQNYPGEAVWIDGSVPVVGTWAQSGSTWSTPYTLTMNRSPTNADGQDDGWGAGTGAGGWWVDPAVPTACWPDMVFYDGAQLTQVDSLDKVGPGKFFIEGATTSGKWFKGTRLHIGDNPAGHEVRYSNKAKFATFSGTTNTSTIRGIGIRRYASYSAGFGAMYVQHSLTLENVWAEDIASTFTHFDKTPRVDVTKLTARRIGFNCFGSNEASNITIDRADIRQCNYANFYVFGPSIALIKFNKCQYSTVKNSIFKDSNSTGFWVDSTGNTPVIYNCLFEDLSNRAIDYETASDGIIANCKFIRIGADVIFVNDSDTTRIYNCTFAECNWGVAGRDNFATSKAVSPISVGQSRRRYDNPAYSFNRDNRFGDSYYTNNPQRQWTINYITMCNTVIARPGVNAYSTFASSNNSDNFREAGRTFLTHMHPTMDGNLYHWTTRPNYPWICAAGYNVNPKVYFSLNEFRTATGLDANSSFSSTDPLDSNYRVTDQAYHNKAVAIPADIAALIGHPANSKRAGAFW